MEKSPIFFSNVFTYMLTCSKGAGGVHKPGAAAWRCPGGRTYTAPASTTQGAWPTEPTNPHSPLKM